VCSTCNPRRFSEWISVGRRAKGAWENEHWHLRASRCRNSLRAKKVIGTDVKDPAGKSIGKVEDILLEKQSNNIMYAVVGFGGFLGMGEKYHPLPWRVLNYDDKQGAYIVNLTKEQLAAAPADSLDALTQGDGLVYRDRVYDYYKTERYW
jgi:sporulation protein YlmC with PRC-barrel domain